MTVINRITQLVRANLNDLIDKAEDPEKMIKQVILDMEEGLKVLKGQIAVAMADKHLLEKQSVENKAKMAEWLHKAELCVAKNEEPLARTALERYVSHQELARQFEAQLGEQDREVGDLKGLFQGLEQKLVEARSEAELLMAQHRRARALGKAGGKSVELDDIGKPFDQFRQKILRAEALGRSQIGMVTESTDRKLERLEKDEKIDHLLAEIKGRVQPEG